MRSRLSAAIPIVAALAAAALVIAQTRAASESPGEPVDPRKALMEALESGDRDEAAALLDAGADPGWAIVDATRRGDPETLRWLFDRGVVAGGRLGARALLRALNSEDAELAPLLRAHGADLDATEPSGMTLLMALASTTSKERRASRILSGLIEAGADVNKKSLAGRTALLLAVKADRFKTVRSLLDAGAEVDVRDRDGWTPLMLAARDGRLRLVTRLLEAGADPNAASAIGWTPLMWAAWFGHVTVVGELLGAGADPNASSYVGGTALIRAVQGGRRHVVRALLAAGARRDAELAGVSVAEWARLGGRLRLPPAPRWAAGR